MTERKGEEGNTIQWPKEKEKERKYNVWKKREGQTMQWQRKGEEEQTNTMAERKGDEGKIIQWLKEKEKKDRQYNDWKKEGKWQTMTYKVLHEKTTEDLTTGNTLNTRRMKQGLKRWKESSAKRKIIDGLLL